MNAEIVNTVRELIDASKDEGISQIILASNLISSPSICLHSSQSLRGQDDQSSIAFESGSEGLQLSSENQIQNIRLECSPEKRAIFNDTTVESLGRIDLQNVTCTGRVQILARDNIRSGQVRVNGLDIVAADARGEKDLPYGYDRPSGYGVYVLQGAFTLWNMQPDDNVAISAELSGISLGRPGKPVLGSGVFVCGAGDKGGSLTVSRLETDAIYTDGKIAPGTPDQITRGVFTVYGTNVELVRNRGPVMTYGVNDMVLDNWGKVERWIAEDKITSYGPSGIGFVNFGTVNELIVEAPIETFGEGARGYNVYTGTVNNAEFDQITTHGNGSVGIQISQPIGRLCVRRGIETFGGTGQSLVKGVVMTLSAIGLSIKPGGSANEIDISGGIKTHGTSVSPLEMYGRVESFRVSGGLISSQESIKKPANEG